MMTNMNARTITSFGRAVILAAFGSLLLSGAVMAQTADVITIGHVAGNGTVTVPVSIRDVSGTPLGIDQPAGSRIQSYSIRVTYTSPAVQSISFSRAGITTPLTPTFESSPAVPGAVSLLGTFDEATNLIPFTSNAAAPGNQIARLVVTIAPGTAPGTMITLTLDPVLTQLTNQGGTTSETVTNTRLALVSGAIVVSAQPVPLFPFWVLVLLAVSLAMVAVRMQLS